MKKRKMNKRSDIVTLLVHLLQGPSAKELCKMHQIDQVRSVHLDRVLREDASRYWNMIVNLENDSFKLTIEDNNEEEEE